MESSAGDREDLTGVLARAEDDSPESRTTPDDHSGLIALTLARAIVAIVFCGFGVVALVFVLSSGKSTAEVALAVVCLASLLGLQYFYFSRPTADLRSGTAYAALAAQAGLSYLPLVEFGQSWVSQPVFLAGSALLVLPLPVAWPVFTAVVASTAYTQSIFGGTSLDNVYVAVNAATAGLYIYGLTRLGRYIAALHEARDELAKSAVAHERLRFASNLHGLLGLSLSAIAPKGELTLRLIRRNPGRAKQEVSEILEISRRALADVRSLARVYRESSLDVETETLASMLTASNVELRMDLDRRALPAHMSTALAAVLREGIAAVLRYRTVERCEIVARQVGDSVVVDIVNDGVRTGSAAGDGLDTLSPMVSRLGGDLTVGTDPDGRLHLHITLPVTARAPDGSSETDEPKESIPRIATKLAGGLVIVAFFGFFVQAVLRLLYVTDDAWQITVGSGFLLATLVLQLGYFSRPGTKLASPTAYLLLGLQALLVYLPLLEFEAAWTGLPGFLAGSALLVFRPAIGWSLFAAVVATVGWSRVAFGAYLPTEIALNLTLTISNGLIIYGLTWMARSLRQLRAVRQELAAVALAGARVRFARDLHDLLGLSLSAITLKSELAYRLILLDPARAHTELDEVLKISRQALADVRSVASGYHEMSLEEECRSAESLLGTAGLDVRMAIDYADLPAEVSTVLATVLREGVTNVLRHSKGEACEISIQTQADGVRLRVTNDGVTDSDDGDHWGSGIRNMSDRVASLGGVLTAGFEGDGRFGLCARIPTGTPGKAA